MDREGLLDDIVNDEFTRVGVRIDVVDGDLRWKDVEEGVGDASIDTPRMQASLRLKETAECTNGI